MAELKPGLVIKHPVATWTVLRVYPSDVKVQVLDHQTGRVRNHSVLRSRFDAALAAAQSTLEPGETP